MKKKILSLAMIVCMLSIAIVGGTLAYFTDTDSAKNVMTLGKVDIEQNEYQRAVDTDGNAINDQLVAFEDNKPLMPRVPGDNVPVEGGFIVNGFINPAYKNVVDKIVKVKNLAAEGAVNQDAYVRTILAFETAKEYEENTTTVLRDGKEIFKTYIGTVGSGIKFLDRETVTVDGVEYVLAVKVYADPLKPGQESTHSLKQFFMSPNANNEVANLFGETYNILALSQATQTAGFATAEEALNAAFGDLETIDEAELIKWLEAVA